MDFVASPRPNSGRDCPCSVSSLGFRPSLSVVLGSVIYYDNCSRRLRFDLVPLMSTRRFAIPVPTLRTSTPTTSCSITGASQMDFDLRGIKPIYHRSLSTPANNDLAS
jgi:hypothetical protein